MVQTNIPPEFLDTLNTLVERHRGNIPLNDKAELELHMQRIDEQWARVPPNSMEDEFVTGMRLGALHKKGQAMTLMNSIFTRLDTNGDGILTKDELR